MKKLLTALLALMLCASVFTLASCRDNSGDKGEGNTRNPEINAVYVAYVAYAAEQGEDPLGYDAWLASIKGADGANGLTPAIGENGNWWIGDSDTGVPAKGEDGVGIERVELDEDGNMVIVLTNGLTQTVVLPKEEVHEHSFDGLYILADAMLCTDRLYMRFCSDCGSTFIEKGEHSELAADFDADGHWIGCERCNLAYDYGNHIYDAKGECECGASKGYDIIWKQTPIIYELTMESDGNQFPSGAERYYAGSGVWADSADKIDVMVRERNNTAEKQSKTKISYRYIQNGGDYYWSASIERIFNETRVYSPNRSTDIYSNFAYDLTCASLKGCFANLRSNTDVTDSEYGAGNNYFRFNEADYVGASDNCFDAYSGEGYLYDYMKSLTLSDDKMYILASDYTTDLMRAAMVVPVNVGLMNSISRNNLAELVRAEGIELTDDMTNIEYFYELVWSGNWNYETLLAFSRVVYRDNGIPGADITDTLGFAMPSAGGIAPTGILYSSSVGILDKHKIESEEEREALLSNPSTGKNVVGDYLISYPDENKDFAEFSEALRDLFAAGANAGISVVSSYNTGGSAEIRASFVNSTMLFGSIVQLCSLEGADYQSMRENGGYGIAPVPVYKAGAEYNTFAHNNARLIAIARLTLVFEQCAVYLDSQSRHSSDVLAEYYNTMHSRILGGDGDDGNVKMLIYIRNHVRDGFDKTVDDMMAENNSGTDSGAIYRRWHEIIQRYNYQVSDMSAIYQERLEEGRRDLLDIINAWNNLK